MPKNSSSPREPPLSRRPPADDHGLTTGPQPERSPSEKPAPTRPVRPAHRYAPAARPGRPAPRTPDDDRNDGGSSSVGSRNGSDEAAVVAAVLVLPSPAAAGATGPAGDDPDSCWRPPAAAVPQSLMTDSGPVKNLPWLTSHHRSVRASGRSDRGRQVHPEAHRSLPGPTARPGSLQDLAPDTRFSSHTGMPSSPCRTARDKNPVPRPQPGPGRQGPPPGHPRHSPPGRQPPPFESHDDAWTRPDERFSRRDVGPVSRGRAWAPRREGRHHERASVRRRPGQVPRTACSGPGPGILRIDLGSLPAQAHGVVVQEEVGMKGLSALPRLGRVTGRRTGTHGQVHVHHRTPAPGL